jgi:2-keto-3-deoxy-L-rhamnonate aldolase
MTVSKPEAGIYTPSPTFFKKTGPAGRQEIDIETQVKHTIYLADNGIKGAVLLGSTGEMIHLTRKERYDLVAGTRKGLDEQGYKDFPILAGVAQNSVEDTLEDIKSMKEAGAIYAMALAPDYFAPSTPQEGIISWFNAVADESVLPIVIYYFPGVSNNLEITPATVAKLSAHPNIVGIKMSHGNVSHYIQVGLNPEVQQNNFSVMTGLGQLLLPAMVAGVEGTIDAISGAYPKTLVKLFELIKAGKIAEAQKIQYVVSQVEEIIVKHGPVGTKYAITNYLGYGNEGARAPIDQNLTAAQIAVFEPALQAAAALEKSL